MASPLKAPFPWFGGKSRVADLVWERFGNVATYNEPFAGSLAVLLGRPHEARIETVNDLDCYLANFWRALQADPDVVAKYADSPVNEADLHARHRWLVGVARKNAERCMIEPDFYDAQIAGWWVWGQCLWIGSGWCEARRVPADTQRPESALTNGKGVHRQFDRNPQGTAHQKRRPQLTGDQGTIVYSDPRKGQRTAATFKGENPSEQHKRPHLQDANGGKGVHRRWQGGGAGGGSGVIAPSLQKPLLRGANGMGLLNGTVRSHGLYQYLQNLAARLRRVRVCCGDWKRVLTPSVTTYIGVTGVFLDPPYSHDLRERCYSEDHDISGEVREWALANGDNREMRIALCGYEGEHQMPDSWACVPWKAHGGYSRSERGKANRTRERIWFSPHCLNPQEELFQP